MIDFILGFATASGLAFLIHHFTRASSPMKAGQPPNLETMLEGVRLIMTQQGQDILTALDGLAPKFEAKLAELKATLDAERAGHAEDLAAIADKVTALAAPDPEPVG